MAFYQIKEEQFINQPIDKVWEFICDPKNLQRITPDDMGFEITSTDTPKEMYEGLIISYKVAPLFGIKTTWVTEITHVRDQHYFVDEQRIGPYKMWHHQHILEEQNGGTLMKDIVSYSPPFGFLGRLANSLIIRSKLKGIFEHRRRVIEGLLS